MNKPGNPMAAEDPGLPLNCPTCGRRMRFVDANSPMRPVLKTDPPADPTFFVFECPEHGLFHYGPTTPLTAGNLSRSTVIQFSVPLCSPRAGRIHKGKNNVSPTGSIGRVVATCLCSFSVTLLQGQSLGQAQGTNRNRGLLTLSAFLCATYAELSGDAAEQKRLFGIGYAAAQQFVAAAEKNDLPEAERRKAPMRILWLLQGPTVEFVVGRIFEDVSTKAFDEVVKEDENGLPRPVSQWADGELKISKAETKYRRANCSLIR